MARDLQTVLRMAHEAVASGKLRWAGDSWTKPALRRSRRAAASGSGGRESCGEVRMGLTDLTPSQAFLRTSWAAPEAGCLPSRQTWLDAPVERGGPPNNYRSVTCSGRICSVRWGQERTVVDAVLDRGTGAVVRAELEDVRTLKERGGCDTELAHCAPASRVVSRRRFSLRLRQPLP
jgi:hypothetical protein